MSDLLDANIIAIAKTDAKSSLENTRSAAGDLKERLKTAMSATKDHWMCTSELGQMLAASYAVMEYYGEDTDEYRRIDEELSFLRKFSAVLEGRPIGSASIVSDFPKDPVGLLAIWNSI